MATTWDKDYLKSMAPGAENGEKEKSKEKERKKKEDESDSSQDRSKNRKQRPDQGRSNKKRKVFLSKFNFKINYFFYCSGEILAPAVVLAVIQVRNPAVIQAQTPAGNNLIFNFY